MNQKKLKYNDNFRYEKIFKDDSNITNTTPELNIPGLNAKNDINFFEKVDTDTYLRFPSQFCRDKNNNESSCDNIIISNEPRQRDLNTSCYWDTPNKSQGRGFGDLDKKNVLWYAMNTRNMYGDNISTYDLMDYKFHNTYRNYQDSNHLVMNIPRGGFDTRHLEKKNKFKNI